MTNRPIVFLDTETTGLHADRRPWEIAWIRREIDGTETERLIQISDVDLTTAELKGLQVGRFHERYFRNIGVDQKPDNVEIDREFLAAHAVEEATRGAIIIGAVPNFDTETLAAMLRRHRLCPSWHYQLVDIETYAAGWLRAMPYSAPLVQQRQEASMALFDREMRKDLGLAFGDTDPATAVSDARAELDRINSEISALLTPPYRSDDLSRACGVEPPTPEERHTALGDARWVKRWYDHITGTGQ
ncbi:hypothetical protein [Rhodococcus zopfii]|uniref:hypothetical protein n=1 Tax=Rhodococcus zopfii TaxID=43772 RepID=UPI0009344344|nr:hypothetical protein [Rhodococcus zopfii]